MGALLTLFDDDGFNPRRLFLSSTIGAIYAYDDFSYLYQKSDGSVPVTALEQPVGLVVDQRWGGMAALGSNVVINGTFDADASWTKNAGWAITGGAAVFTATSANSAITQTTTATASARWYVLSYEVKANTLNAGALRIGGFSGASFFGSSFTTLDATVGTKTRFVLATPTGAGNVLDFWVTAAATSGSISIDNISIRELPGLHAYQSTDAARHTLKGTPRYGLFDRVDDHLLVATGGGSTTGFMLAGSIQPATDGVARTIFSDRGTNTGYKVEIDATNKLLFTAGNGAAYTTCTGPTLTAGTNYSFCVWHDGTNLNIKVGTAAVVQQAFATATAGTSTVTLFKDNAAASGYFSGRLYALTYIRNASITEGIASQLIGWAASKGGFAP